MGNDEIIYNAAINEGMTRNFALCVVSQAKHETANFTSGVFNECNNAFGYKQAGSNPSCANHSVYQSFPTVSDSVQTLIGWWKRRFNEGGVPDLSKIASVQDYAYYLKYNGFGGYYGDTVTNYTNGMLYYYDTNIGESSGGKGFLVLVLIGSFLFHLLKRV